MDYTSHKLLGSIGGDVLKGNFSTKVVANRVLVNPDKYPNNTSDHITDNAASYVARDPPGIKVGLLIAFGGRQL